MTPATLARAICCDGPCSAPDACRLDERRPHLVDVRDAAARAHRLLCEAWRTWPRSNGPMSVERAAKEIDT